MESDIWILIVTAASLGFFHTLLGPDHYLPFIVMSKARNWTTFKTVIITMLCGLGHVVSSIIIGAIGIVLGIGLSKIEGVESTRGDWAAYAFLIFGIGYFMWAVWRLKTKKNHEHIHSHDSLVHIHQHNHQHAIVNTIETPHAHGHEIKKTNLTPWILFLIFVLGPCEPLIPLLMYPAAQASTWGLIAVTLIFALTTIITMVTVVLALKFGFNFIKVEKLEKYTHVIAGATIALSGILILSGL